MQVLWLSLLILGATNAVYGDSAVKDVNDPIAVDNNAALWRVLYTKLNTLLNETELLTQRLEEVKQKQEAQEILLNNVMQNITWDSQKQMNESFLELIKRQDAQDNLIRTSFNHSEKWTPILRRQDGSLNFYRNWEEYRKGFGDSNGEFFIGLDKLHIMTTYGAPQELLVVMGDFDGETRYAKYDLFQIGNEAEKYALKLLGKYSGNAGDALLPHKGMKFSTYDKDNDTSIGNCAKDYSGAWWFYNCHKCLLTGPYRVQSESTLKGITWYEWKTKDHSLKFTQMLIRSKL